MSPESREDAPEPANEAAQEGQPPTKLSRAERRAGGKAARQQAQRRGVTSPRQPARRRGIRGDQWRPGAR